MNICALIHCVSTTLIHFDEDEGDNYNYEQGIHSTITFHWNNATRTLTIADREGSFPGMLTSRQFNVVLPDGSSKMVEYSGKKVEVKM